MQKMKPNDRRIQILKIAIQLSQEIGYMQITRDAVAERAEITSSLIARYFPRMKDLRQAIITAAIDNEILDILAQGISLKDPLVTNELSINIRKKVINYLMLT